MSNLLYEGAIIKPSLKWLEENVSDIINQSIPDDASNPEDMELEVTMLVDFLRGIPKNPDGTISLKVMGIFNNIPKDRQIFLSGFDDDDEYLDHKNVDRAKTRMLADHSLLLLILSPLDNLRYSMYSMRVFMVFPDKDIHMDKEEAVTISNVNDPNLKTHDETYRGWTIN